MKNRKKKSPKRKSSSSARHDPVTVYAKDAVAGRIVVGRPVLLACLRHLDDLKNGPKRGLRWDLDAALWTIEYFETVLKLSGGAFEGDPFIPDASQKFIIGSLFGWKNDEGYRRFRVAYVEAGKGNGKSPLGAGIGTYMTFADNEPRAETYIAAVDRLQAMTPYRDAVAMVRASDELASRVRFSGGEGNEWNMAYPELGSFFRPISSESRGRGKSGPRVHCAILDELHEHATDAMIEFMRAGTKGRRQALLLAITNSGFDRDSVCWHYHDYAWRILEGQESNDAFFAYVCSLDACDECRKSGHRQPNGNCDDCDDWRDEAVWIKANPLLDTAVPRRYLREQVREAEGMPSKANLVKRLNFCMWTESDAAWIGPDVWKANGAPVDVDALEGRFCYGGLDLSQKNDLTALVLVFPDGDGTKDVLPFFWTPREGLARREAMEATHYRQWVDEGHLEAVPGSTIDYGWVAEKLAALSVRYRIEKIAFDPWRKEELMQAVEAAGADVKLEPHTQGLKDMTPAIETLEDDLLNGRLRHGNHPVLTWCSANAVIDERPGGLRRFSKRKAAGRIDGVVALAMAVNVCRLESLEAGSSIYDSTETAVM